jgi:hypothetical protein
MNVTEYSVCLEAFNNLCKELNASNLVKMDESQYWVFERGYKAALDELISNISIAAKSQNRPSLEHKYLAKTFR